MDTLINMTAFISRPEHFKAHFRGLMSSTIGLFEECSPEAFGEPAHDNRFCFSLTAAQERPVEFLQSMLDLLRVTFEPKPPATMQLNSNWDFVYESVPAVPFRLGYFSMLGPPGADILAVREQGIDPRMRELGYSFGGAYASFVSVAVGSKLFADKPLQLNREVLQAFRAGFSPAQAMSAIATAATGEEPNFPRGVTHVGTALDDSLSATQLRVSAWLFLPALQS